MRNDPSTVQVPDRIYPIVECLLALSDRDLSGILAQVQTLARDKKGTHTAIIGESSEIAG
jgi:Trm5-related predicted tRNA methylase